MFVHSKPANKVSGWLTNYAYWKKKINKPTLVLCAYKYRRSHITRVQSTVFARALIIINISASDPEIIYQTNFTMAV